MQSILSQILQNEDFIAKIQEVITNDLIGMCGTGVDEKEGLVEGNVQEFEATSTPIFDNPNGEALKWTIDVKFNGSAIIQYIDSEGDDGESEVSDLYHSSVNITFPDDTLISENIKDIVSNIELEILKVYSAPIDAKDPMDELKNDAIELYVELESLSHDELVKKYIQQQKITNGKLKVLEAENVKLKSLIK